MSGEAVASENGWTERQTCSTRRGSICLNILWLCSNISQLRPPVIFFSALKSRCNYRCSVICRGCVCVSTHACPLATGGQAGFVRTAGWAHPSAWWLIAALQAGLTWPPGDPSPFPPHRKILAPCCILFGVWTSNEGRNVTFWNMWTRLKLTGAIQTSHFHVWKRPPLYRSTFSGLPTYFFVQNNEQGSSSVTAKVDSALCQADMTWTTITFNKGRLLFHNLTLHVSRGVSPRGRDFSNHEAHFPCCGVECIWRSEP